MYPFKIIGGKWGWRPFQAKDAGQGELKPCQIEEFCCFGYLGVNLILVFSLHVLAGCHLQFGHQKKHAIHPNP
jgi:hypothetical protein